MLRQPGNLRLLLPLGVALLGMALMASGGDLWLADRLYAMQAGRWQLQSHWLASDVLHSGGRRLSVALGLLVLLAWIGTFIHPRWQRLRRPLGYLLLSVLASTLLVSTLKAFSPLACPWDLQRYGGVLADSSHWPGSLATPGKYFPAGHASAGFAWVSLYFFLRAIRPAWRHGGLLAGLCTGTLFGLAQQLRGAHFLSHDLFAGLLCWLVAASLANRLLDLPGANA